MCILCKWKQILKAIVTEATTLCHHIEACHEATYNEWSKKNEFESKLPKAVKNRKEAQAAAEDAKQTMQDPHLKGRPPREAFVAYSDELFCGAAIEWLVSTDQPIRVLEHPTFHKMINIVAHATKGIMILNRKVTRRHVIDLFKSNLTALRKRVMSEKAGLISLTCDAWQALNADTFFAVTDHWNKEVSPGVFEDHSALFGFTQMYWDSSLV